MEIGQQLAFSIFGASPHVFARFGARLLAEVTLARTKNGSSRKTFFATESQKQCFSRRQAMSKTVLFDLVFLTPRQKVLRWPASITYNRPLGVVKLNCRFCTLLKASEPFFDRFLAAATRVVDCWSLFVMNNNAFDVARYILSSAVN